MIMLKVVKTMEPPSQKSVSAGYEVYALWLPMQWTYVLESTKRLGGFKKSVIILPICKW